jgi:sugar phosphate isomerase/epimerase
MPRYSLGVSATSYLSVWESIDTLELLDRCHKFGAAGIQAVIHGDPVRIRREAEKREMYVEAMVPLPVGGDSGEFEQSLKNAQAAGATALRAACLGTRRYETFQSKEAWDEHVAASHRSLRAAVPLLEKYKIPLGLENHKDWTADELVSVVKQYSSEYFGVCLDFGNNIALLDIPMDAIEKLAPYAVCTHVKDIAVDTYEEGILLSEVILGEGLVDIRRAMSLIRRGTRMTLEMITREPLRVPFLRGEYWGSFSGARAGELAGVLGFVSQNRGIAVPQGTEDENIVRCLEALAIQAFRPS